MYIFLFARHTWMTPGVFDWGVAGRSGRGSEVVEVTTPVAGLGLG